MKPGAPPLPLWSQASPKLSVSGGGKAPGCRNVCADTNIQEAQRKAVGSSTKAFYFQAPGVTDVFPVYPGTSSVNGPSRRN